MAYHLNVLFLIPLPQDRHPVAALELGKYNMLESAQADRDEFSTGAVPKLVTDMQKLLEARYECPVTLQYQITCPPPNTKGLSI